MTKKGWRKESYRHGMSGRGIKTMMAGWKPNKETSRKMKRAFKAHGTYAEVGLVRQVIANKHYEFVLLKDEGGLPAGTVISPTGVGGDYLVGLPEEPSLNHYYQAYYEYHPEYIHGQEAVMKMPLEELKRKAERVPKGKDSFQGSWIAELLFRGDAKALYDGEDKTTELRPKIEKVFESMNESDEEE